MGACGTNSRHKLVLFSEVKYQYQKSEFKALDEFFTPIFKQMEEVEYYRRQLSVSWGNILKETGAIVLSKPTFYDCMRGFVIKRSIEKGQLTPEDLGCQSTLTVGGIITAENVLLETPVIKEIAEGSACKKAASSIVDYLNCCKSMKKECDQIYIRMGIYKNLIDKKDMENEPFGKVDQFQKGQFAKKFEKDSTNVKHALTVLTKMRENILETNDCIPKIIEWLKNKNSVTELCTKAQTWVREPITKIMWNLTSNNEDKINPYENWERISSDFSQNEKEISAKKTPIEVPPKVAPTPSDTRSENNEQVILTKDDTKDEENIKFQFEVKKTEDFTTAANNDNTKEFILDTECKSPVKIASISINFIDDKVPLRNWNPVHEEITFLNDDLDRSTIEDEEKIIDQESVTVMEGIPELNLIVTGNKAGYIKFWKVSGKALEEQKDLLKRESSQLYQGKILSISWFISESLKYIFTGGEANFLVAIKVNENEGQWQVSNHDKFPTNQVVTGDINSICNVYDGKNMYYSIGSKIAIFNVIKREITDIKTFVSDETIYSMTYMKDQKLLVYSTDFCIQAFNPFEERSNHSIKIETTKVVRNLTPCAYGDKYYIIGNMQDTSKVVQLFYEDGILKMFKDGPIDIISGKEGKERSAQASIIKLFYAHDKKTFVAVFDIGVFYLKNIENDIKKKIFYDQTPFTSGCYLGDGKTIAIANDEGKINVFSCP